MALYGLKNRQVVAPKGLLQGLDIGNDRSQQADIVAQGITHLIITGVTTEVCVQTTMREANDRGYECLLVEDATESYFPEFKQSTLEMVRAQDGIIGWTGHTEALLSALAAQYETPVMA